VKKGNGGAIATIGATRTAYGSLEMGCGYLSLRFYEAYATSDTVSEMLTKAQIEYINNLWKDYFTIEEFILLGDPSLKIGGYDVDVVDPVVKENVISKLDLETGQTSYLINQLISKIDVVKTVE